MIVDFLINLGAGLAFAVIEHVYNAKLTDPQRKVLTSVYERGFEQMLRSSRLPLAQGQLEEVGDVLTSFIAQTGAAEAYLALALHNDPPDLDKLIDLFRQFDGPIKLRGTGFDFERGMIFFVQGLSDALIVAAGEADSPIANLVTVSQNRAVIQALGQFRELVRKPEEVSSDIGKELKAKTQYHSCFISYSSKDELFVVRLYQDLRSVGVPCWYAPEDIPIGGRIRQVIDEAIQGYDKVLIVLSRYSVRSSWVEKEVETAFEAETQRKRKGREDWLMLFPIRVDGAVIKTKEAWAADVRRMRNIGDFSQWKKDEIYQARLQRLLRDLCKEAQNG